ncbi:DUF6332 family protein [Streptomyces sp. NPDC051561]|uniref:DUF6332 family protein n=1 Tax=Streptomyces sp. NPDC051561 TaxID=3365658 RepID=UPI0037B805D0
MTIEIGFALVSAAVLAGLTFLGVAGPPYLLGFPAGWFRAMYVLGGVLAVVVFVVRVVYVLWRYQGAPGTEPNGPGRTDR